MSADRTPAVERAAAENPRAYGDWNVTFMSGQPVEPASIYVSRRTLTAALDAEEMVQAILSVRNLTVWVPGGIGDGRLTRRSADIVAAAVRAALLGAGS